MIPNHHPYSLQNNVCSPEFFPEPSRLTHPCPVGLLSLPFPSESIFLSSWSIQPLRHYQEDALWACNPSRREMSTFLRPLEISEMTSCQNYFTPQHCHSPTTQARNFRTTFDPASIPCLIGCQVLPLRTPNCFSVHPLHISSNKALDN